MNNSTATLSALLKKRREDLGLTQLQLASRLNLRSGEFISLVESRKRRFDLNRVPELARVLGVKAKDLTRLALYEQAPAAFVTLFGEQRPSTVKDAKPEDARAVVLEPEMRVLFDKLFTLRPNARRAIETVIDLLLAGQAGTNEQR